MRSKYGKYINDVLTSNSQSAKDSITQIFTWPGCCLNINVSSCPYKNSLYKIRRCILRDIKEIDRWPAVGQCVRFTNCVSVRWPFVGNINTNIIHIYALTHWGRVTHIYIRNLIIIGSDKGLAPGRRQTIIWTNAGILLIGPVGKKFSENLIEIHIFSFKKMYLKVSSR